MSDTQPHQADEVNQELEQVHELGSATEQFFSRLYSGLMRRIAPGPSPEEYARTRAALATARVRGEQLQRLVDQKTSESDRLRSILLSVHEGVIIKDLEGHTLLINDAARNFVGDDEETTDRLLAEFTGKHHHISQVQSEIVPLGTPHHIELNSHILAVQTAALADDTGNRIGTLVLLQDMTAEAVNERVKRTILSHLSHELNTPMNVMRMATEMLRAQPEDAPANRRMLEMLSRNIDILDRMVRELLDVSEISTGNFEIRQDPLHLETLVWTITDSFEEDILKAQLNLRVMVREADKLLIAGDAERLTWVLNHLIRNALYYNEPDGFIEVAAYIEYFDKKPRAVISVIDNGTGISDADKPRIFDLFYRGKAMTRGGKRLDPRGMGQGLFVAKTITEKHGGIVQMESKAGEGSHFRIVLPLLEQGALAVSN